MNAFDQAKPRRKVHKTVKSIDVELITIKNDPFPGQRACPEGKYAELFAKMKPGQCLSCEPDEVQPLGAAMRKWIASQDKADKLEVRTMSRFPGDSRGRVWLIAIEAKLRALLAGVSAPAAQVIVDFEQIGSAGPIPVVNGRVKLPEVTMVDLARMLKPTTDAQAQADARDARQFWAVIAPCGEGVFFRNEADARWTHTGHGYGSDGFGVPTIGEAFRESYEDEELELVRVHIAAIAAAKGESNASN